jgi:hypothetical protein
MPIRDAFPDRDFEPATLAVMNSAYNCALTTLGIKDRADPATKLIAEKIASIVDSGVRDGHEVYEKTVAAFKPS